MCMQQINICFLFAVTYILKFTFLLFAEKNISFSTLSIAAQLIRWDRPSLQKYICPENMAV